MGFSATYCSFSYVVSGRAEARASLRLSCCLVGWELICPEKAIGAPKESEHLGGKTSFFSSHQAKVTEIELAGLAQWSLRRGRVMRMYSSVHVGILIPPR